MQDCGLCDDPLAHCTPPTVSTITTTTPTVTTTETTAEVETTTEEPVTRTATRVEKSPPTLSAPNAVAVTATSQTPALTGGLSPSTTTAGVCNKRAHTVSVHDFERDQPFSRVSSCVTLSANVLCVVALNRLRVKYLRVPNLRWSSVNRSFNMHTALSLSTEPIVHDGCDYYASKHRRYHHRIVHRIAKSLQRVSFLLCHFLRRRRSLFSRFQEQH